MIALYHAGSDPRLLLQLERWLEQIAVQTHHSIEAGKRRRCLRSDEPAIAHQPAHDGAVLLLRPGLIVLAVGARPRHFQSLTSAPADHQFVHEGAVIVEVHPEQREGKQRPGLLDRRDHKTTVPRAHRHALGPAGGDIGQNHGLDEAAGGRGAGMGHEVDLDIAGRRIVPVAEGAHRYRAAHCRTHAGARALTANNLPRSSSSSTASRPCRSRAGNKIVIIGFRRFEQRRSDASHNTTRASRTLASYRVAYCLVAGDLVSGRQRTRMACLRR